MLLDEVAKLIDDNSTSRTIGINLFKSYNHPATPDTCTFVNEYPGRAPQLILSSSTPVFELPRVQIIDRSTGYQTARNASEDWYRLFMGQVNVTLKPSSGATGITYLSIMPIQSPFNLGQDDNGRHQVACNFECSKQLST